jgi:hypothetical protein
VGDELVTLELSFWEKLGALHSSPRASINSIEGIEFVAQLWGSSTLRGVRAPGTALPYLVLLGTLTRPGEIQGFCCNEGQGRRRRFDP